MAAEDNSITLKIDIIVPREIHNPYYGDIVEDHDVRITVSGLPSEYADQKQADALGLMLVASLTANGYAKEYRIKSAYVDIDDKQ